MIILFLKAHQMGLFEEQRPVSGSVTKDGTYRKPHTRRIKVAPKKSEASSAKLMNLNFENVSNLINNIYNPPVDKQETGEKKMETTPKRKRLKNENESLVDFITNNINDLLFD